MPTPNRRARTPEEQQAYIDERIVLEDGHHIWQLAMDRKGFPKAWDGQRCMAAHRLVFMHHYKVDLRFQDSVVVTCPEPLCVNPGHLAMMPRDEAIRNHKTCKRGHPWKRGTRTCSKCKYMLKRKRLLARRGHSNA